jgi:hypothetical protein
MTWDLQQINGSESLIVRFRLQGQTQRDPLASFLPLRSVDRRPYRWRRLIPSEKAALQASTGSALKVDWHESLWARSRLAHLTAMATDIRLRCPEAFPVHQRIIDWDRAQSPSAIPAGAVGLAGPVLRLMRWAMGSWKRMRWLNRLGGTTSTALQLDYLPGLASGAHFVMRPAPVEASHTANLIEAGRSIQRFWLTATKLGLVVQPLLAVLAFADYGERRVAFTAKRDLLRKSEKLATAFGKALAAPARDVIFIGRVGEPRARLPLYRSSRYALAELIEQCPPASSNEFRLGPTVPECPTQGDIVPDI